MLKKSSNSVHHLSIHLIFVVKYRKKLLIKFGEDMKKLLLECSDKSDKFDITHIEVDRDHVHMMIDYIPTESVSNIVRQLKSYSVFHIWRMHGEILEYQFWKEKMFWSKSYFVCSVGDCSRETVAKYIESQGGLPQNKRKFNS